MSKGQAIWSGVGAVTLPIFEFMYGSGKPVVSAIIALLFFIALDWVSGTSAARKDDSYGSKYGIDGAKRSFFMLLLPAGGHFLDLLFGLPGLVFGLFAASLLYHTIRSMTANVIRAGWADWIPVNVLNTIIKWVGSELDQKVQRAFERRGVPIETARKDEAQ